MANYKILNMWTPASLLRIKAPYKMDPNTLTVHNTGNTASAVNEARYMNSNNRQVSYHVVGDHKNIVQLIPFNRNAWAAGDGQGPGNRTSIHYEIAYSMDNGYSGSKSSRYKQAEENAALYIAYVLHQKGWGINRLRQHFNWSGKDCPHKIRATKTWNWFVGRVQQHLNAIKGTSKAKPSKNVPTGDTQRATGSTYKVKKNDTLWGIATANGTSVKKLKALNGLKSNVIKPGQNLKVKGTPPKKADTRNRDSWGWHWSGTFVAAADIAVYRAEPRLLDKYKVPSSSGLKKGNWINFDHLFLKDGHWIIRFKYAQPGASNDYFFAPVGRKLSGITFRQANEKGQLWGKVSYLNSDEEKSGVTDWHKKGSVKKPA